MTDQERITALEARIATLEARLATLEQKPTYAPNPVPPPMFVPTGPTFAPAYPMPPWTVTCGIAQCNDALTQN